MAVESNMRLYSNVSPADIGVASKLFPRDPAVLHGSYPYETAVQELNLLCRDYCPQKKLECIGKLSVMIRTTLLVCYCSVLCSALVTGQNAQMFKNAKKKKSFAFLCSSHPKNDLCLCRRVPSASRK